MSQTHELLRGELERLFELEEMTALSFELLGYDTDEIGGALGKGTFARALVTRCARDHALEALADAIVMFGKRGAKVGEVFKARGGLEIEPGAEIAGFRVTKELGAGGLGKVFLADRETDEGRERVALKVIRSSLARDASAVARFLTNQRAIKRAEIPGLARVIDCGVLASGQPWVASDYVDGQTLSGRIERIGPMHINEAKSVFVSLLSTLQALHDHGLVHADVKSGNVLMVRETLADGTRSEPKAVLVDPGAHRLLAGGANRPDALGSLRVFGNAQAIAPEMARGDGISAASDIYAAGIMLYEVLTGTLPFTGASAFEVIAKHLSEEPVPPSQVAPKGWVRAELDALVLKSLAKDPAERFGSAREFSEALAQVTRPAKSSEPLDQEFFDAAKAELLGEPSGENHANTLEEIAAGAGEWALAIAAFQEAAEAASHDDTKKSLLFRVARIEENELSDHAAAAKTYRAILEIDPSDRLASAPLEELYRIQGEHEALAELLLDRVDEVESVEARAALLREIGDLYEDNLGDPDNALVAWTQALVDQPESAPTLRAIERLCGENMERWNEVLTSLNEVVQSAGEEDKESAAAIYALMGKWYGKALQRPDFALPCYQKSLELNPKSDAAYEGTLALYRRAKSWQETVELLQLRAKSESNRSVSRDYLAQAAQVVREHLGDTDRAVTMLEELLREDAGHPGAITSLAGIYEDRREWDKLTKLLREQAKQTGGAERVAAHLRLGELYEDRLSDLKEAEAQFEAAAELEPSNLDALKGLARIHARSNDYEKLLYALERQLEATAVPRQRVVVLEQIGGVQEEEFLDHAAAALSFERILEIDGAHEAANAALARLYRHLGEPGKQAAALERHAQASTDDEQRVKLLVQAATLRIGELNDADAALELAERALSIQPDHPAALSLAARVRAKSGDANAAVQAVDRLAERASDPAKKAERYLEAATLLIDAGELDQATRRLKLALDADPENALAADKLGQLYRDRGDHHGAVQLLRQQIKSTGASTRKAALYADLAALYQNELDEPEAAKEAFQQALELDPTSNAVRLGAGMMAFERGDFVSAAENLEPLLSRLDAFEPAQAKQIALRSGDALAKLGKYDKAQRAFLNAKALSPGDREILERVAEVTFEGGEADQAAELYRELLESAQHELSDEERGRILLKQGDALIRAGSEDEALKVLEESMVLIPEDPGPAMKLADAYEAKGQFDKVVLALRQRMERASDDERFTLLVRVGDVLGDKLADRDRAAKSYAAALEIKSDDRNLLTKLMGVYSEAKDWPRLLEVILRIAELIDDEKQVAKYYLTAGSIAHSELKRHEEAVGYYAQALQHDASLDRAKTGRISALRDAKQFDTLAQALSERAKDTSLEAGARAELYDELAQLQRDELKDAAAAADSLEQAHELSPGKRERLEALAEIFDANPKKFFSRAVDTHQRLLAQSPYRVESYRALKDIYAKTQRQDEVWCVAQALVAMNTAEADEKKLYSAHKTKHPAAAQEYISEAMWFAHLIHPDQDPLLTGIFAEISPAVIASRSQPLSAYDVKQGQARDPERDSAEIVRTLHYVAGVSQLELPSVYYREADPGGLSVLFSDPAAIGVGKGALAGGPPQALAFIAARHLSYYRPGHYLRHLVPSGSGLRAWLLAAIKIATPQFPVPGSLTSKVDDAYAALQTHISEDAKAKIRDLVQKLLAAAPELDMKRWVAAVDYSADRLGFVMSNSLEMSVALIKAAGDDGTQKDRLKQLYLYSVSRAYMELREKLGIAIDA